MSVKRVLIIAAAAKQRPTKGAGLAQALDRYNSVEFQTLRELRSKGVELPHLIIISPKYGFLNAESPIAQYQKQMSEERVDAVFPKLSKQWTTKFRDQVLGADFVHLHLPGPFRYCLARMGFFYDVKYTLGELTESYNGMHIDPLVRWVQGFRVNFNPQPLPLESLPADLKTIEEKGALVNE